MYCSLLHPAGLARDIPLPAATLRKATIHNLNEAKYSSLHYLRSDPPLMSAKLVVRNIFMTFLSSDLFALVLFIHVRLFPFFLM